MKRTRLFSILYFILIILNLVLIGCYTSYANSNQSITLTEIGQYDFSGYTYTVKVINNIAYVSCGDFWILNVSDPSNINVLAQYPMFRAHKFWIADKLAYVTDEFNGLKILNISDPTNPFIISTYNDGGTAVNLFVVDDLVYLADVDDGLEIIDTHNITNPNEIGTYSKEGGISTVYLEDYLAYVIIFHVGGTSWLDILDITDETQIEVLGRYNVSFSAHDIEVENGIVYVANWENGIELINVTDPANPSYLSSYDDGGFGENLEVVDDILYLADNHDGLQIYNTKNPSSIHEIGRFFDGGNTKDLHVVDNIVYVTDSSEGLEIIKVEGLEKILRTAGFGITTLMVSIILLRSTKIYQRKQKNGASEEI